MHFFSPSNITNNAVWPKFEADVKTFSSDHFSFGSLGKSSALITKQAEKSAFSTKNHES